MVSSFTVPFSTDRYSKGSKIKLYKLPLIKRKLLKAWLARIRCESIPVMKTLEFAAKILKGKKGKNDVPSIFVWTKAAKEKTFRKSQSNADEQPGASESQFRVPVMELLTPRATVTLMKCFRTILPTSTCKSTTNSFFSLT